MSKPCRAASCELCYAFAQDGALQYDLYAEASMASKVRFIVKANLIWNCLEKDGGKYRLELRLEDINLSRISEGGLPEKMAAPATSMSAQVTMTERGKVLIFKPEADYPASHPVMLVLKAVIQTLPRLPAGPVSEGDTWAEQEVVSPLLLMSATGPTRVLERFECEAEKVPWLFSSDAVLDLSSKTSSLLTDNEEIAVYGSGKGKMIFSVSKQRIKAITHQSEAIITFKTHPTLGDGAGERSVKYMMRLSMNLINKRSTKK